MLMFSRLLVGSVTLVSLVAGVACQSPEDQEALKAKRAEKLAKPVFQKAKWQLDYDQARAAAKQQGKWVLAYFTRSYAP